MILYKRVLSFAIPPFYDTDWLPSEFGTKHLLRPTYKTEYFSDIVTTVRLTDYQVMSVVVVKLPVTSSYK